MGEGGHPVMAREPPERRLEFAGRDRGERGLHRLVGGFPANEGVEGGRYHWVRSRSTG